jgi:hypothetical protein
MAAEIRHLRDQARAPEAAFKELEAARQDAEQFRRERDDLAGKLAAAERRLDELLKQPLLAPDTRPGVTLKNELAGETVRITGIRFTAPDGRETTLDLGQIDDVLTPGATTRLPLTGPGVLHVRFNRFNPKGTRLGSKETSLRVSGSPQTMGLN